MSNVGLVIARYDEDLAWVNEAQEQNPDLNVYIYNKTSVPFTTMRHAHHYNYIEDEGGNEAATYLLHMLRMFDSEFGDRLTLFVQGRPYDHVHKEQLYRIIRYPEQVKHFEWLAYHKLDCKIENECHHRGLPIAEFYHDLMVQDIKSGFHFGVGGMFAVDREIIYNAGYEHLLRARELILTTYRNNEPWCILERVWDQVLYVPNAGSYTT